MTSLTQEQIDELKKKGLDDIKIRALATKKGYTMPSTLSNIGNALIKSEKNFGQSIAGAIGGNAKEGSFLRKFTGQTAIDEANMLTEQVKQNTLKAIQDKRARGEDTSRLVNALQTIDSEINFYDILNKSTGNSLDKSAKQVFGEAAGVATDIIGAGALPGGIGKITKATSFTQGAIQGAKAGAISGGIFGTAQGAARSAQEDESAGKIVGAGIGGGVLGGVTGGVLGGALGGVSGAIRGRAEKVATSKQDFVLDLVSENPTKKVREMAVSQGRVTEPGMLGKARILPSTRDYRLADAVDDVVSPKNTPFQNVTAINSRVDAIDDGVTQLIKSKKVPFNTNQLVYRLNAAKADSKLIFASDATAERTYDAVVDEFVKHVEKKDTLGLFQARKTFDHLPPIKKLLESEGLGENVKKQIVLDVRRSANEYIASLLPTNNPYRALLRQESAMLEAVGNIAEKSAGVIGRNNLQLLTKKYPILKWLIGALGLGVGSSIVGSVD